jgi:hypothetical protein
MCRLTVLTKANKLSEADRLSLFWTTLILSETDDMQHDGAGISDGKMLVKTDLQFSSMPALTLERLGQNTTWMGHVRKKSPGTASGVYAAHPYEYMIKDRGKLIFAHNGYIRGLPVQQDDAVNTDSYRAGRILAGMLENGADITKGLIETWVAGFGYGSEWSFIIMFQGTTYIVRGHRSIWGLNIGDQDCTLFNTSEAVIRQARSVYRLLNPKATVGIPILVPHHNVVVIPPDGGMITTYPYILADKERPAAAPYMLISNEQGEVKTLA